MKSKEQTVTEKIIAVIVIACSAVLLTALAIPLMGLELDTQKTITLDLPTATGIRPNSQVRYAGTPVGRVLEIKALGWEERSKEGFPVRVIASIDEDTPEFKSDSVAEIASDTLLAEKFIDIDPGTQGAAPLAEGQIIYSKPVASFDDLTREGMVTLETVNDILVPLRKEHADLPARIIDLIETADELATKADTMVISINQILEGNQDNLNKTLTDLNVVMQNLKVVSTYSKALTGTLGRKPWRVIWGTDPNQLPTEEQILNSNEPIRVEMPQD
jgi:ABC-type transporter Mla subunit MlaD